MSVLQPVKCSLFAVYRVPVRSDKSSVLYFEVRVYRLLDEDDWFASNSSLAVNGADVVALLRGSNPAGTSSFSLSSLEHTVDAAHRRLVDTGDRVTYAYSETGLLRYLESLTFVDIPDNVYEFLHQQLLPVMSGDAKPDPKSVSWSLVLQSTTTTTNAAAAAISSSGAAFDDSEEEDDDDDLLCKEDPIEPVYFLCLPTPPPIETEPDKQQQQQQQPSISSSSSCFSPVADTSMCHLAAFSDYVWS